MAKYRARLGVGAEASRSALHLAQGVGSLPPHDQPPDSELGCRCPHRRREAEESPPYFLMADSAARRSRLRADLGLVEQSFPKARLSDSCERKVPKRRDECAWPGIRDA